MTSVSRRFALGLVGMLAAFSGAAGAQVPAFPKASFTPQDVKVQRLTPDVHMTKDDQTPARGFAGPMSMEVHPDNPRIVVAATADLRTRICRLLVSTDAGLTWAFSEKLPAPDAYPYCTNTTAGVPQASLAWGRDGRLYYAMQAYGEGEGPRGGGSSIALARTTDLGKTWTTTIVTDSRTAPDPKPENTGVPGLAIDTSGAEDTVYVGFSREWRDTAAQDHPLFNRREVAVSASTDGGRSFAELVNLNDHSKLTMQVGDKSYPIHFQSSFGRPYLAVHDGVLLAVADGGPPNDNPPPTELYAGTFGEATPMLVGRSTDHGKTWAVSELTPPIFHAAGSHTGMGWTPKGGADGTFVFVHSATPGKTPSAGRSDIVVQRSTDKGLTWSEPVAINDDDPNKQYTSFYPQLDVAPNGRVDVVWQDNRDQTDWRVNVRYSYSTDGGKTWAPNQVVNQKPIDFNLGISYNSDIRQGPGVASANQFAAFGWADARFANTETQTQDNFGVVAQFSPLPHPERTGWLTAASVLGGLLLAGVVLLALQALRKT